MTPILACLALALFCYFVGRCHEGCREGGTLDLRKALEAEQDVSEHQAETIALLARERDRLQTSLIHGPRTLGKRGATVVSFRGLR